MQKPAGQTRVALELTTAAEKAAKAKAIAQEKFDAAEQAFQQRDYTAAKRLIDEADAADPNQPATINLRGEILLAQKDFDGRGERVQAGGEIDPKFREAQYNLAQIPFKKKDYTKARDRFEALFNSTPSPAATKPGGPDHQVQDFLTLLLEGKTARPEDDGAIPIHWRHARALLREPRGSSNITTRRKPTTGSCREENYSPALNMVFADSSMTSGGSSRRRTSPPRGRPVEGKSRRTRRRRRRSSRADSSARIAVETATESAGDSAEDG